MAPRMVRPRPDGDEVARSCGCRSHRPGESLAGARTSACAPLSSMSRDERCFFSGERLSQHVERVRPSPCQEMTFAARARRAAPPMYVGRILEIGEDVGERVRVELPATTRTALGGRQQVRQRLGDVVLVVVPRGAFGSCAAPLRAADGALPARPRESPC